MGEEEKKAAEELEKLRYLQELYMQEYNAVLGKLSEYAADSAAMERNREVLNNIDKIKGNNILLNLEGGSYIEVKVNDIAGILTYVGAGYIIETDKENASRILETNSKRVEELAKKLNAEKEKLEGILTDIEFEIEGYSSGR
ncbi:MAG: hypothetical protein ACP5MK_03410 [Candidatus Micrarchaeia archaeon]